MISLRIVVPFNCDRTCPANGEAWCRFRPILDPLGPVLVNSHTARIKTEFHRDPVGLKAVVEAMGGEWLGQGTYHLYDSSQTGFGFRLPNWRYPIVAGLDGQLYYDDYRGKWGNIADIEKLRNGFINGSVLLRAQALGWQCEQSGGCLTVYHPSGGKIEINRDTVMISGFLGGACHEAREQLGLPVTDVVDTTEANQVQAMVQELR